MRLTDAVKADWESGDNNWCKAGQEETAEKAINARAVPIPNYDPIFGRDGPLVQIWSRAATSVE